MEAHGVAAPASYLAVMVQDLDGMGMYLSGTGTNAAGARLDVGPGAHAAVSATLRTLAAAHRRKLASPDLLGVPVYAGGDDLLAFVPAATALAAAQACHDLIPGELPRASTAVLFFHYHAGLQAAMTRAQEMLHHAKAAVPLKHALAVGYMRRSGATEFSTQPWAVAEPGAPEGPAASSTAELLGLFAADRAHPLSPRLAADLERDAGELSRLFEHDQAVYRAELARLVGRHIRKAGDPAADGTRPAAQTRAEPQAAMRQAGTGQTAAGQAGAGQATAREAADALWCLGQTEYAPRAVHIPAGPRPARAARIGVFLRQEAR